MRGATIRTVCSCRVIRFQPTRPLRGATIFKSITFDNGSISTHAPLAGRDGSDRRQRRGGAISTHAPLAGRDSITTARKYHSINFNPRAPCGARLGRRRAIFASRNFNPRAPCGARRDMGRKLLRSVSYFNPRAPCGARRTTRRRKSGFSRFQPTRPLRGATVGSFPLRPKRYISTHAPLAGRDPIRCCARSSSSLFQPTRPLRGATLEALCQDCHNKISTHAPLAGRDEIRRLQSAFSRISTHAPLAGRDSPGQALFA